MKRLAGVLPIYMGVKRRMQVPDRELPVLMMTRTPLKKTALSPMFLTTS